MAVSGCFYVIFFVEGFPDGEIVDKFSRTLTADLKNVAVSSVT